MSVVLITGSSSGIGNVTARELAVAGHTVYASMRAVEERNEPQARELVEFAAGTPGTIVPLELDVQSQRSADAAVSRVLAEQGRLDVIVHNAGHLVMGYAEAFSAEELAHLIDINVLGQQRVNRAALPHLRAARSGYLVYVGSTTTPVHPPFMAPYVTSKVAGDALAETMAVEVSQFGIDTTIVMPGALTEGTNHFPNASVAADTSTTAGYTELDALVAEVGLRTVQMNPEGMDASPAAVGRDIVRLLALPAGARPLRSLVDYQAIGLERVLEPAAELTAEVFSKIGMSQLLTTRVTSGV